MDEAQKQAMERAGAQPAGDGKTAETRSAKAEVIDAAVVPATKATGNGSSRSRSRNSKKKGNKSAASPGSSAGSRAQNRDNGAAASIPAGAVIVPRKASPAPDADRGE